MASAAAAKKCARLFQGEPAFTIQQPQIGFMNQSRSLKRLPRLLVVQPLCGETAQFLVDERQ